MNKKGWKIVAFICIIITAIIIVSNVMNYFSYAKEEDKINECQYDMCWGYSQSQYKPENNTCYCYDYGYDEDGKINRLILYEENVME